MEPTQVLSYVLGCAGLALAGASATAMLKVHINHRAANSQLAKLAAANNLDRFVKLCSAAPGTYLDAAKVAARTAMEASSTDPVAVDAAMLDAFDAQGAILAARWRRLVERGLLGAIISGGGVVVWVSALPMATPIGVIAVATVLVTAYFLARRGQLDVTLSACRADVLPLVLRSVIGAPQQVRARPDAASPPAASATPSRTLRDGSCPLCQHTKIKQLSRSNDDRFTTYVCERCGFTQEFADVARL